MHSRARVVAHGCRALNVSLNQLSSTVPSVLSSLRSLQTLDVSDNNIEGPLPTLLGSLTSLTYVGRRKNVLARCT